MPIDKEVKDAIKLSVLDRGQASDLADQLIGWLDELSEGKTALSNWDENIKHIELILASVKL